MASTHKSLRSGTANKRPTTSIADGQIALNTNTTSPGLFFKDSTGATIIKVGPVHVGTTAPNASPAAGGSAGNSVGEIWLDTSLTPVGVKIWNGSAFVNATPIGSTTVQGLLELATSAETQTGTDTDRAVTPAGLQSKVSDSTSTTSSTTIASSTAVKSAYDLANAALPKSGGTVTGNLEIGTTGSLSFEGATADAFETTIAVTDPTADRTITLPDTTGTVVTTGDTGTVTSAMIADGTIVDGDISASAEIAVSKLADGTARQLLQTDAAGTGVEWASNIDVPGTLDVTSTATFDSIASHPLGSAAAPTLTFTGDTNTGIYSPGADQVAISTNGTERVKLGTTEVVFNDGGNDIDFRIEGDTDANLLFVDASSERVGIRTSTPAATLEVNGTGYVTDLLIRNNGGTPSLGTSPWLYSPASGALAIGSNANERLRITSTGALNFVGAGTAGSTQAVSFNGSAPVNSLVIDSSGRVGLGTSSPGSVLDVRFGTNPANDNGGAANVLRVLTTVSSGADIGGAIALGGKATGTSDDVGFGQIAGRKTNATSGNYAGYLQFSTLGSGGTMSEKMRITDTGLVGIGTTSPDANSQLHVVGSSYQPLYINTTGAGGGGAAFLRSGTQALYVGTAGSSWLSGSSTADGLIRSEANLIFGIGNSEKTRIDSSGRLLVGTSSARSISGITHQLQIQGTGYNTSSQSIIANSNDVFGAYFALGKSRGTSIGSSTVVQSGDILGAIHFAGADGTDIETLGAAISAEVDGTPGSNDMPGRLVFSTTADGASSPTERMRISSSGGVLFTSQSVTIGSPSGTGEFYVQGQNAAGANARIYLTCPGSNEGGLNYERSTSRLYVYSQSGGVYLGSTATSWTANSDERLKDIIEPIENAAEKVSSLRAVIGKYKTDEEGTRRSFLIAQDVQAVLPEAVSTDNPDALGVAYTDVIPLLVAAIKELKQDLDAANARLDAAGL